MDRLEALRVRLVHQDKNLTIVEADVDLDTSNYKDRYTWVRARGISKRDPIDKPDFEVAEMLAIGRALETLGKKILKHANGRVKMIDDAKLEASKPKKEPPAHALKAAAKKVSARKTAKMGVK